MLPCNDPDRIQIAFDDHRLVANAGLILPVTLAHHLGLGELVDHHVDLGRAPGRANASDKLVTLVASALAGGDCIDGADAHRSGRTGSNHQDPPARLLLSRVDSGRGQNSTLRGMMPIECAVDSWS